MKPEFPRLAVVCSHPVQYYAPWFRHLARHLRAELRVFYLWQPALAAAPDPEFGRVVRWDVDLLSGYAHEFVENRSARPGTDRFRGLRNPALPARLRAFAPDAVLVFGYGWETQLRLALGWRDCPLILRGDSHLLGRPPGGAARAALRALLLRALFTRFAAFAAVGRANRELYLRHGVPPARIFHVPHCVDNAAFAAAAADPGAGRAWRSELGVPAHHRVVGFVGKFVPKKRPDLLLRAFLRAAPTDTTLLLVGDGPLEAELRALVAGASGAAGGCVRFAPFQNQSAMPRALAALDLLVLPSEGPGETWGLVVNEAMAVGVPALVSTHVGCREDLVADDETGWGFPAGDEVALAAALTRALAALSARADSIRAAARARVARYSYDAATIAVQGLLDAVLPRHASYQP
jgi:glycosyltransferase involved in cell wall biosynthesis